MIIRTLLTRAMALVISVGIVGVTSTTPVSSQERFEWTMVTTWPTGIVLYEQAEMIAERVESMSNGRLTINVQPAGTLVGAGDVLDAVNVGTAEMGHAVSAYWIGKHQAAPFFSTIPMAFEGHQFMIWMYEGGGLELWNELYQDVLGLNVLVMPGGANITEFAGWSNKPITSIEDYEGLKYRTIGWWADILRDMGASVTTLPASELYPALERGVLDATEFASPGMDRVLGFHEVADFVVGPGMHQPSTIEELIINKDAWEQLPPDLQRMVEVAAEAVTMRSYALDYHQSLEAFEFFQDKVEFTKIDEDSQREFREQAWAYLDEQAEQDSFFSKTWDSVRDFQLRLNRMDDFLLPIRKVPDHTQ
jgi:TRAP-type mannitol/chloroaromatic compound transport system substrate-binding protein